MLKVAIAGGTGGIARALIDELVERYPGVRIDATHRRPQMPGSSGSLDSADTTSLVRWSRVDVTDEASVADWVHSLDSVDWLINCVGVLHSDTHQPEKSLRQFDPAWFKESMDVNCLPTLLLAKHAQRVLKASDDPVFATVSARVGSISDNALGGWYSYRASKAALNMALKCVAIEWARTSKSVKVLSLHPGTTDTGLSEPFHKNVSEGKLFSASKSAGFLLDHVAAAHRYDSGRFIAWDGQTIPW